MYYGNYNPMYLQNTQRISAQQAQQIALGRVPGQILHVDLDMENGILVYEVYIMTPQNRVYEVEINAKSGRIVKVEQENDHDFYD
ncbi:putative membrane protein YkoI [Lysinibacillus composti]|uniref:Peptidase M4 n=1 Tax=Lysinibacillus composti TaxID=720633 RepID=A0A3N9U9R2_9BACI|nr:PepSY domain-containing protein [Lysinibacillus composti]MBM7610032.1 putative membrane protein YkoI [Lysinibacillus composti]RQW73293.1 peptidase M4 [Lysinibacillus composti]